ncbi:MAG: hypothetical protein V1902_02345 [Candidatus Falkowbacteria bacterium]
MSEKDVVRPVEDFGKDLGLVHEVVVTGRKVGAGRDFWARLAHDEAFFRRVVELDAPQAALLQLVGTISVPAMPKLGKVRDLFVVNTKEDARCKISYVRQNFHAWFDEMDVLAFAGSTLCCQTLMRNACDSDILQALGGEVKAETNLAEIYWLMEQQRNGGDGIPLADGRANIFYVRDKNRVLRAVCIRCFDDGWSVFTDGVGRDSWHSVGRVFSRSPR